jgi:predicted MFS family arabinose efflux permease
MAGLYYYGLLQPWCLILLSAISSCFLGVLFPSFTASLIHLVPQKQLTRAQGLLNGADGLIRISAPPLAGILYAQLGLVVILAVDLISFTIAIALLCLITLERRSQEDSSLAVTTSVIDNSRLAWRYLINKPGLLPLFGLMAVVNYCFGTTITSMTPLVLTLKDSQTLGFILSCAGLGSLFGSLFILRYATTQRAVPWILRFTLLCAGAIFLSSFQNYVPLLMLLSCVIGFGFAVSITCYQSLLVRKIHPDIQGRVLGLRGVIEGGSFPLGNLVAGSIVDYFEPMMQPGGALAGTVGLMIGTGPGRGAGLLISLAGLLLIASTLVAMFNPSIKRLEARLPNYGFTNEQKEDY